MDLSSDRFFYCSKKNFEPYAHYWRQGQWPASKTSIHFCLAVEETSCCLVSFVVVDNYNCPVWKGLFPPYCFSLKIAPYPFIFFSCSFLNFCSFVCGSNPMSLWPPLVYTVNDGRNLLLRLDTAVCDAIF